MSKQINELKMILQSIQTVRAEWLEFVNVKFQAELKSKQGMSVKEVKSLYKKVSSSNECMAEYARLITLYGCIGENSAQYIQALESLAA